MAWGFSDLTHMDETSDKVDTWRPVILIRVLVEDTRVHMETSFFIESVELPLPLILKAKLTNFNSSVEK